MLPVSTPDDRIVNDHGSLVEVDRLIILADDEQTRADLQAAVAPHGGMLVDDYPELQEMGIYSARFPVNRLEDLESIRLSLRSVGIRASMSYLAELFA